MYERGGMNYIVGSGWWCTENAENDGRSVFYGSDWIRSKDFHKLWYWAVNEFTSPQKIFIVDSASPVAPDLSSCDPRLEFVSLPINAGHSTNHLGKFSGWTRSVLLGLEYAMASEADYFVYIEQDVLISGWGIVEYCIGQMRTPYMFGAGNGTSQVLQQSFFVVSKAGMRRFADRLRQVSAPDREISPEDKFFLAASRMGRVLSRIYCYARKKRKGWARKRLVRYLRIKYKNYDELPFGFGRSRPIDFGDHYYYFQHASQAELDEYIRRVQLPIADMPCEKLVDQKKG